MSKKIVISCDNCGISKRETNHWWQVWREDGVLHIAPASLGITVTLPNGEPRTEGILDACGQACAVRMLDDFFTGPAMVLEGTTPAFFNLASPQPHIPTNMEEALDTDANDIPF